MTDRASRLLDEVIKLTPDEKAEFATALLAHLDEAAGTMSAEEVEAAWRTEVRRRLDRAVAGEPGVPLEQVQAEARELLRKRRG